MELLDDVYPLRPSVLDLGCGTGTNAIKLVRAGAHHVTGIDLSPSSIEIARLRASSLEFGEGQADFEVGDAAATLLRRHDWVLFDRVICCYHDPEALLGNAIPVAGHRLAFSAPGSRGWRGVLNASGWGAESLVKAILPRPTCRGYVHDLAIVDRLLVGAGFRRVREGRQRLWYAAVYERVRSLPPRPEPRAT